MAAILSWPQGAKVLEDEGIGVKIGASFWNVTDVSTAMLQCFRLPVELQGDQTTLP